MMEYIAVTALVVSVAGLLWEHFAVIAKIQERIAGLEVKIEPFWKIVETRLPRLLMEPSHQSKDLLLNAMQNKCLSVTQAKELKGILEVDIEHPSSKDNALTIVLLLARLEQIIG